MSKSQIFTLIGCMIFMVGILFSLFAISPFAADIPRQPFSRDFNSNVYLTKQADIDLNFNSFYIAGAAKNTIYLGNWTAPFHLVQVGIPHLDTLHMNLSIKDFKLPNDYEKFRLKVDSPLFCLTHGVMPGIFTGLLEKKEAASFSPLTSPFFVDALQVDSTSFVLKSFNQETNSNELARLSKDSPYFEFKPDILEKQIDGFFCIDGTLLLAKDIENLVYVYSYRNEYIVMDKKMNAIKRFNTIDTFSRAPIEVTSVTSKNYKTLSSPKTKTNQKSCISGKYLFIQSPLLAKNEDKLKFQESATIDVYDVKIGKYQYSFHLDIVDSGHLSSFTVLGNRLVAIYERKLVLYNINFPNDI